MNRRWGLRAALGCAAATSGALALVQAWAQTPAPAPAPIGDLKSLGDDRYQLGRVVVDKRARRFSVPGRVHLVGKPLEYLATSPGGMKAYETLFELDASGSEFNLACILVGLERDPRHEAVRRAGAGALAGPRVAIFVAWNEGNQRRQVTAAEAVLNPSAGLRADVVEWVYIGAPASSGSDRFAADVTGTLIGFRPDDNNIIESALGIGIGAYGSVRGHAMLPPTGTAIELIVEAVNTAK